MKNNQNTKKRRLLGFLPFILVFTLLSVIISTTLVFAQTNSETEITLVNAYGENCLNTSYDTGNCRVSYLFDGDKITKWYSSDGGTADDKVNKYDGNDALVLQYSAPFEIDGYEMQLGNDSVKWGRVPTSWKLYGSNDGKSWTQVQHVTNGGFSTTSDNYEKRSYSLSDPVTYSWYKFEFLTLSVNEDATTKRLFGVQLSELVMKSPVVVSDAYADKDNCSTPGSYIYNGVEYGVPALFDNDTTTKWYSQAYNDGTSESTFPLSLTIRYSDQLLVSGYKMTTADDNVEQSRSPVEWKLYGSNDGTNWCELDHVKDGGFTANNEEKSFALDSLASYVYYKFEFLSIAGGKGVQLSELKLVDDLVSLEDLVLEYGDYVAVSTSKIETKADSNQSVVDIVEINGINYIHAIGVGDAEVTFDGEAKNITVKKAKINFVLVSGQSNAHGGYGLSGTVHEPDRGNGFYYDGSNLIDLTDYRSTVKGSIGWYHALAAEWYSLTGEKTVIIKYCKPGESITSWASFDGVATSYTTSTIARAITGCIEVIQDSENMELVRTGYYWLQGEDDAYLSSTARPYPTAKQYATAYMAMHEKFVDALTVDGLDAPYGGIFACRTRNDIINYNAIEYCSVRVAQQYVANKYDDIYMCSVIADGWTSADINYTSKTGVTVKTNGADAGANNIHYNQIGYNILGMDAADNMYDALISQTKPTVTDFEVIGHDGRTKYSDQSVINVVDNLRYLGANNIEVDKDKAQIVVRPLPINAADEQIQMTVTDSNGMTIDGVIDEYGHINTLKVTEELTLTVKVGNIQKTFTLINDNKEEKTISFDDENIKYVGRWVIGDNCAEGYWSGTYFETKFTGDVFGVILGSTAKIYVAADGKEAVSIAGATGRVDLSKYLDDTLTEHTVRIGVANDKVSCLSVKELIIGKENQLLAPDDKFLIEFIGDSITAGSGLDPESANTYAYVASDILGVDYAPIAIGGIALVNGNNGNRPGICTPSTAAMNQRYFWQKPLDQHAPNGEWNFSTYSPDMIVINLGTNDAAAGVSSETFASVYTQFIKNIRAKHGNDVPIIMLIPMQGFMKAGVVAAYDSLNDSNTYLIDASSWITSSDCIDGIHPTKKGHTNVATLLAAKIRDVIMSDEIESAKALPNGFEIVDEKNAAQVEYGVKFVTTKNVAALNDAINTAISAKEVAVTLDDIFNIKEELSTAVSSFRSNIKVGTYLDISSITFDKTEAQLAIGDVITLKVTISPESLFDHKVTWTSSNEKVAIVNNGTVTAVGRGTATITVTVDGNDISATCKITVTSCLNGHNEVVDAAVAPTCTESGLTEGKHCRVCGEVTVVQEEIEALGHSWVDATTEDPKTCKTCGATEGEKLPGVSENPIVPDDSNKNENNGENFNFFQKIWLAIINFFKKLFNIK